MSNLKDLPLSGYSLLSVFTPMQELRAKEVPEDVERQGALNVSWDWAFAGNEEFDVNISVSVEPIAARPEYFAATVVGRFRQIGKAAPSVVLEDFVRLQAVAILLPYVRQVLSNLTSMSLYGSAFYLPSLNVITMMKDFDPREATGAQQLRERENKVVASTALPGKVQRARPHVKHK